VTTCVLSEGKRATLNDCIKLRGHTAGGINTERTENNWGIQEGIQTPSSNGYPVKSKSLAKAQSLVMIHLRG